jgi:hypothetical protein
VVSTILLEVVGAVVVAGLVLLTAVLWRIESAYGQRP